MGKNSNPFSAVDDDDFESATTKEKEPVVDLDAEPDEPDEPERGPSRQEKKSSRTWMNKDDRERLERAAMEAEAKANAATLALQQIAPFIQQAQYQQRPPQVDPIDTEIERASSDRQALDREYEARYKDTRNPLTAEELDKFRKRATDLDDRRTVLLTQKTLRQSGMAPQNREAEAVRAWLVANHAEATQNQQAIGWAQGVQQQEQAMGKNPWSVEVLEKAMDSAERQFKLGRYKNGAQREPDPNLRDRYAGPPRSASAAPGRKGDRKVVMDKTARAMADAAFPHIKDDRKRWEHWAKQVQDDE